MRLFEFLFKIPTQVHTQFKVNVTVHACYNVGCSLHPHCISNDLKEDAKSFEILINVN